MLIRSLILCLIFIITLLISVKSPPIRPGENSGVVMDLPATLPGLISEIAEPDEVELRELPSDTQFAKRVYYSPMNDPAKRDIARCSIVLSGAERKSIHRPEKCLVAQGWTVESRRVIPIEITPELTIKVTDLRIEREMTLKDGTIYPLSGHYVYWFIGSGITTPSHASRSIITVMDNLLHNINHRWAYVSVLALNTEGLPKEESGQRERDDEQTMALITRIVTGIVPHVHKDMAASLNTSAAITLTQP